MRFPFFLGHPLAGAHEEQQDQEGEKSSEYDADWKADPKCRHGYALSFRRLMLD
jgi:hypothetical protein